MKQSDPNFKLRMPANVHEHLKSKAQQQRRTMGAHIVFLLQQEMEKEKAPEHGLDNRSDASHHHE